MQAYLAILRYDIGTLTRSWVARVWLPLLAVPALFLVAVSASEDELASETMGTYVAAVLAPFSALAVAVLAAGAVASEAGIMADSILSRSVTRTEYLAAKITARVGFTAAVYFIVMVPFAYLVIRYAEADTALGGVAMGVLMVGVLLIFLAALGLALSTVISNVLLAVLSVLVAVLVSGVVLQFLGLSWMSTTAVIEQLPKTFRGETAVWDQVRVVIVFTVLTAVALVAAIWLFRQKDL